MNKKNLLLCLFVPLMVSSCKSNANKITIAEVTRSIFYAPMYVSLNENYFKDEGLDINIITTPGADKTMAALLSKEAQIGLMGPEASIYVYNNKQENYAINFAQLTQKDGSFLISREKYDYETFSFDALKNKTIIGGRKGGMPEMVLEYVLKQKGYDVGRDTTNKEINIRTDIQFDVMAGAFSSGNGDFVTLFEPSATKMEEIKEGYIVASIGQHCGNIPYTCFSALKNYMNDNDDKIKSFVKGLKKGVDYVINNDAKDIAKKISKYFPSTDIETITKVVERYKSIEAYSETLYLSEESFNKLQDIIEMAGELKTRAPYEKLVTTKYL
ncbi:MAG: ABC transporter substrate-binding protein [Candidatus Caccosoma sp.]|nr:ABC transporter substrate-binding protein [Candidatus Caccosoma sp.]